MAEENTEQKDHKKLPFGKVTRFQMYWNLDTNKGGVRLWVEGHDTFAERELDAADFAAVGILLGSQAIDDVVIGKTENDESFIMGGKK